MGQLVISTSTTRPSRLSGFGRRDALRLPSTRCGVEDAAAAGISCAGRNQDGLRHAVVERDNDVICARSGSCIAKDADDGGVAALEDAHDAALAAAIGFGRFELDQHLVALHGAVDLVGRDEDIFSFCCRERAWLGDWGARSRSRRDADRGVRRRDCRAWQGGRGRGAGNAPVFAIELDELAARGEPGQLLEQQAALAAAAQAQFADQLLVSGLSGRQRRRSAPAVRDRSYAKIMAIT